MIIQRPSQKILTIGNPGLQVISPRGGAAIPWWLSGGISAANCVAAYQPIGAASYAASKVNLANPGTYDAVDGTATPDWDATYGWRFDKANSEYLVMQKAINGTGWSMVIRYKGAVIGATMYMAGAVNYSLYFGLGFRYNGDVYFAAGNQVYVKISGAPDGGTVVVSGTRGYYNADEKSSALTGNTNNGSYIGIGCNLVGGSPSSYFKGDIYAMSVYDTTLNAAQVPAITTAIAAL